jgi:hypothetical protein
MLMMNTVVDRLIRGGSKAGLAAALGTLLGLFLLLSPAAAQLVIPTAGVLEVGEYCLEAEFESIWRHRIDENRLLATAAGVAPSLEVGLAFDLSSGADPRLLLKAKYQLREDSPGGPAVAVGVSGIGRGVKAMPYLAASHDFKPLCGHAGIASIDGTGCWFIGADYPLNDRLTLMVDYINGSENLGSLGCGYQINDHTGLLVGVLRPNDSQESTGFYINLGISGNFRCGSQ